MYDVKLEFSNAQQLRGAGTGAVVGSITRVQSTNALDVGDAVMQIGRGRPIYLNIMVNTGFRGNVASTLRVYLQTSANGTTWASGEILVTRTASQMATPGAIIYQGALPTRLTRYISLVYQATVGMTGIAGQNRIHAWLDAAGATGVQETKRVGA